MGEMFSAIGDITLGQIIGSLAGIFVVLSIFIEITPIKITPVSSALSWFGRKITGELTAKVDFIEAAMLKNDAESRRARILQFGDECRRQVKHSQESYIQVLTDIDAYELYCDDHPEFKNSRTVLTTEYIKNAYNKCVEDNDFL